LAFQPIRSLSGGERSRAALAMLAALDASLLILDEPTNHLDLWARGALERALKRFNGTVLFVSHDRFFLNKVADHLLVVEPGRFRVIEGNYDTYLHLVRRGLAIGDRAPSAARPTSAPGPDAPRPQRESKPARRKRRFPYRKVAELEAEIELRERRVEELHVALATPDVLRDGERVKKAMAELQEQQTALPALYEHLEEASELNG
jgi:ATP-binding cassette subfamily F protein 3